MAGVGSCHRFNRPDKRLHEILIGRGSDYHWRYQAGEDISQMLIARFGADGLTLFAVTTRIMCRLSHGQ